MNYPMIAWCAIAGLLMCAFIFRAVKRFYAACHNQGQVHVPRHIIEMGKERDIFYIPGDVDDDDEFEEL